MANDQKQAIESPRVESQKNGVTPYNPTLTDPNLREQVDMLRWVHFEAPPGTFAEYGGMHVAVHKKKILGASLDPILLAEYIRLRDGIDPDSLLIVYIG